MNGILLTPQSFSLCLASLFSLSQQVEGTRRKPGPPLLGNEKRGWTVGTGAGDYVLGAQEDLRNPLQ